MNGKDMLLGMNYVNTKYVEEAETVTQLKAATKPARGRFVLIAAIVSLALVLMGCAVVALIRMKVDPVQMYTPDGTIHSGLRIQFEETEDVFIELGAYYPQELPQGYAPVFISQGSPLKEQRIAYENDAGKTIDYTMMIGNPASAVEIYDISGEEAVDINGTEGTLYTLTGGMRALVWINAKQGYGFVLSTDDTEADILAVARSTSAGEPLTPTRSESTIKALEELGDFNPTCLPEGFEEQGIMGCPLEEGGGWYSYVRKWYVNKAENTRIYFEYETYAIDTEAGYEDNARTICSFYIPGSNILDGVVIGEETEINGMFALVTGNHIAWADPERHVIYHLTSEDILDKELLKVARSITNSN